MWVPDIKSRATIVEPRPCRSYMLRAESSRTIYHNLRALRSLLYISSITTIIATTARFDSVFDILRFLFPHHLLEHPLNKLMHLHKLSRTRAECVIIEPRRLTFLDSLLHQLVFPSDAFADDIKFIADTTVYSQPEVQSEIDKITNWSNEHYMPLSLEKTILV